MVGRARGWAALAALALAAAVALAGCAEASRVDPAAAVRVHGSVRAADGGPLVGRPIQLGSGVTDLEGGTGFLTVGMFCLSGACTGEVHDAMTGADGGYAFDLTGEDTRSAFGEAVEWQLTTSAAPDDREVAGPAVAARFRVQVEDASVPALALVDPALDLRVDTGQLVLAWNPQAAPGPFEVLFVDPEGGAVWEATTDVGSLSLDPRILEDHTGSVAVGGGRTDQMPGSDVAIRWQSASLGFHGGAGAPPSRGAPCSLVGDGGTVEELAPCPLTDGSLERTTMPPVACPDRTSTAPSACVPAQEVRLDLVTPVAADLLVVRGCAGTCSVSVTPVSAAPGPVPVGALAAPHAVIPLDGTPIRQVVLRGVDELAEVSVWAPVALGADAVRRPADVAALGPRPSGGGAGESRWGWPAAAAVAAIAVALVALGVVVGRRSAR